MQIKRRRGEWVQAGETVVRVLRLDRLRAEGFVSAKQIGAAPSAGRLRCGSICPTGPRPRSPASWCSSAPKSIPVNGQIRVWAELENQDLLLRPGVAAEMTIEPAAKQAAQ